VAWGYESRVIKDDHPDHGTASSMFVFVVAQAKSNTCAGSLAAPHGARHCASLLVLGHAVAGGARDAACSPAW